MEKLKKYITENFEQFFVLVILLSVATINYYIPYKLAFLNFYFIPVLLSAYYLNLRRSLLGAVFCILMIVIYALIDPGNFATGSEPMDLALNLTTWGSFLLLTTVVVGRLHDKLEVQRHVSDDLAQDLTESRTGLDKAKLALDDYSHNLEKKVEERTEGLEKSKHAVEDLKQKVEDALYSTMDPAVVKLIIEKRLRTEKRRLSVLFSDLKSFTMYSEERMPEMVITDLNRFLGEMEEVLFPYHGHIDKYLGDGIMIEFGAPIHFDRHALMAVLAGLKMQERLTRGGFPWGMRVGIATGEAIIGLIGNHRQAYTAIGDTVNIAARIQEASEPGRVTIDAYTRDAVKDFIDCRLKSLFPTQSNSDPGVVEAANEIADALERSPDNLDLLKKLGLLLHKSGLTIQAHEYLKKAMEVDSGDQQVKLAYAEAALQAGQRESAALRGKRQGFRLYEVAGIKDSLLDREKISGKLYQAHWERSQKIAEYPEDILLPVEALDGCIGHSKAVGFLAFCLAEALDLPDQEKKDILTAGYFIDLGKGIIPNHLLNRAGGLSKEEFHEVSKHSRESVRALRQLGYQTEAVFDLIAAHHENYNGAGYPAGLAGEKIPLGSRILALVDAYDALTAWRPYRNRWNPRPAFAELEKDARNGKYDPRLTGLLGKLLSLKN